MTEHTKTDGLPGMDMPVVAEAGSSAFGKAPLRNERMSTAKVECNACPVLCQISDGRTGACDRYANKEGVLVRVDPVVLLRRTVESEKPALVPFNRPGAEEAPASPDWNGDLLHADEVFVTGVGSSTRLGQVPESYASWMRRRCAVPEEIISQQPRRPQPHSKPFRSTTVCPTSPARPFAPR